MDEWKQSGQSEQENSFDGLSQNNFNQPGGYAARTNMYQPDGYAARTDTYQSGSYADRMNIYQSNGYMPQGNYEYSAANPIPPAQPAGGNARKFPTASMLLGLLSAVLIAVSIFVPAIDFSAYHPSVQIRYSIWKICENVALISDMWRGIPIGLLIAAVLMAGLSFVRIPPLKAVPCLIVLCMVILVIADVGHVVSWILDVVAQFTDSGSASGATSAGRETIIMAGKVFRSFQAGIYLLAAGFLCGVASCFLSPSEA